MERLKTQLQKMKNVNTFRAIENHVHLYTYYLRYIRYLTDYDETFTLYYVLLSHEKNKVN